MCLNAGSMGRRDAETETLIPVNRCGFDVAATLRAEGFDASEDGTGRQNLVPIAIQAGALRENPESGPDGIGVRQDGVSYTLEARAEVQAIAFSCKDSGNDATVETSPTLRSLGAYDANGGSQMAVAYDMRGREGGAQFEGPHDTANIRASSGGSSKSYVAQTWAVRRLTPTECERLQGFPDGWTDIEWRKKAAPDGPRYKALGNSMAVNVMRWIGERIALVDSIA